VCIAIIVGFVQPPRKLIALSILAATAVSLLFMLGVFAMTPSVPTVTGSRVLLYGRTHMPLNVASEIIEGKHADLVRARGVVEALRSLIASEIADDPRLNNREEDSPGNFIIIENPGEVIVRVFDHAGALDEIVIPLH
jgi:hypothetical protein